MSAVAGAVPARESAHPRMRWGFALFRLLRRPAAYAWVPLSAAASLVAIWLVTVALVVVDERPRGGPAPAVYVAFAALIGLLVGQAIRELLHCRFSWGLPNLRRRLLPGAVAVGMLVALLAREIFVAVIAVAFLFGQLFVGSEPDVVRIWMSFPRFSLGLGAVSFLAFWIGVRPSAINMLFVFLPLVVSSPWIFPWIAAHTLFTVALTAPLTVFLVWETLSVTTARRQPFVPTRTLSGGTWSRSKASKRAVTPKRRGRRPHGSVWQAGTLGKSARRWVHAGWYENHGAEGTLAQAAVVLTPAIAFAVLAWRLIATMQEAPRLWFISGHLPLRFLPSSMVGVATTIVIASALFGVPIAVMCLAYASITLRRPTLYPRSRRGLADIEYWSSLAETLVVGGLVTAMLLGFWMLPVFSRLSRWPDQLGGEHGWVLALLRAVAIVFLAAPLVQYYRLRHIRSPRARGPVAQLLTVFALTALITGIGTWLALSTMATLARRPLILHVAIFATAALITQYLYRRALERYFAQADLV